MDISVAGYNIDIQQLKKIPGAAEIELTPEIISASYARISRDPRPIGEIREDARAQVDRARRSNEQIVFGVGHSSIAEHAVYNIDVSGVSRYLIEEIQQSRLVSYTEKSQRYITLEDDFVLPDEIAESGLSDAFKTMIRKQNKTYHELYEVLLPVTAGKYKNTIFDKKSTIEGLAKEDARYCVSLATQAQFGMTINARNLEAMLVRMFASRLQEGKQFAQRLYETIKEITPSLIKYVEPTVYKLKARETFEQYSRQQVTPDAATDDVKLLWCTENGDEHLLASLLFTTSQMTFSRCCAVAKNLSEQEKEKLLKSIFASMHAYDSVLREFENVEYLFELELSATCFAQLKRHRMATIVTQPYDTSLGIVVPEALAEVGREQQFRDLIEATDACYQQLCDAIGGESAAYILTNAHKRRVLMRLNARELYHFSRLRQDIHAQWDIRMLAKKMVDAAKESTPLTLMLCTGKSDFEETKDALFAEQIC